MEVTGGDTNVSAYFMCRLVADGTAATGLTPATFDLQYTRSGAAAAAVVNLALNGNGVGGAHSNSTIIEVDATDSKGLYRVDVVDAAFAAGVPTVALSLEYDNTVFVETKEVTIKAPTALVTGPGNLGVIPSAEEKLRFGFSTYSGGVPTALTGGVISVYKGISDVEDTASITLVTDVDGVVGFNTIDIDILASAAFYSVATYFHVVITTGTVGGASVVGTVVATFDVGFAKVDAVAISGDETAADNLELITEQTRGVDVYSISGDAPAANNLESDYDGTGYAKTNSTIGTCTLNTTTTTNSDMVGTDNAATAAVLGAAVGASISADIAAVKAETVLIVEDTGTTIPGTIAVVDANVDQIETAVITNAAGADIAADIIALKAETAAILDDTDLIDDATSGLAKIATDVAAILVDTASAGVVLSTAQKNSIADHVLRRTLQTALDSADGDTKTFRSLAGAVAKLVNKLSHDGTTLTITEGDDAAELGTQTLTTDASADPITGVDTV